MKASRVLIGMVALTLILQALTTYYDYRRRAGVPTLAPISDAPSGTLLDLTNLPVRGDANATVTLVEFSDYECPFCQRYAKSVEPDLVKKFIETGKLRQVFVNYPLPIHQNARFMAKVAVCADHQHRFWEMYTRLFKDGTKTRNEALTAARDLNLDTKQFEQCVDHPEETDGEIDRDIKTASGFNFSGTPSFAVGFRDRQGKFSVVKFINGAVPSELFSKAIDEVAARQRVGL